MTADAMHYPIQTAAQLSTHLKSLRRARHLSQAALGQLIGVGQARIANIEKNPGGVSVEQLLALLHALDAALLLQAGTDAPDVPGRPGVPAAKW